MKLRSLTVQGLLVVAGISVSAAAQAQLATRCWEDDALGTTQAIGRNAWSRKCGYITATKEAYLNSEGEYQVYSQACYKYPTIPAGSDCKKYVPVSEAEACVAGLVKLGTCVAGCYTPTQELAFSGEFSTIENAYMSRAPTVTALTEGATVEDLSFGEQPIRAFVVGDTNEFIYLPQSEDGRRLEVTAEHPMILADGLMVRARSLQPGDLLLGADGAALLLKDVSVFSYQGKVWNVQPVSHNKQENILNAQGFLTGSVRFQNEWANEHYRLSLRDEFDVDSL
jgi:hypothetical protein